MAGHARVPQAPVTPVRGARGWFDELLALVLVVLVGFALVSLPLAMLEAFDPAPVGAGTVLVSAGLYTLWRRGRRVPPSGRPRTSAGWVLVVLLVVVGGSTLMNLRYSAQHFSTERDPGVYVTTAGWLANEGRLLIEPDPGPFADEPDLRFGAAGHYEGHRPDGQLYIQFFHLLPAVLAVGEWIGGAWLVVKINPLLGGIALLFFFAFAARVLRPWLAVAATAALSVNLVQAYFSRDAYTELLAQALVFGGLWALLGARERLSWERGLVAGLALGATCMVRIDSFLYLVPLVAYLVYEELRGPVDHPARHGAHRAFIVAVLGGAAVTATIGLLDGYLFSRPYFLALAQELELVRAGLVLTVVLGAAAIVVRTNGGERLAGKLRRTVRPHLGWIGAVAAVAVVGGALYGYFVRPEVEQAMLTAPNGLVESIQEREGLPVDGTLTYAEDSLRWLGLYLGPVALAAGVAGVAWMIRDAIAGRAHRLMAFLGIFVPTTAVYLWRPSITPDHLWAMRRFLPVAIPGLLLAAAWLVGRMWRWDEAGPVRLGARVAGVAILAGTLAFPLWVLVPVADFRTKVPHLHAVQELCDELPPDAAVLVAMEELMDLQYTQTVRSYCEVPAARVPMDRPPDFYEELAAGWETEGRSLYLLSPNNVPFGGVPPGWPTPEPIVDTTYEDLERTLTGRPDSNETFRLAFYLTPVPSG